MEDKAKADGHVTKHERKHISKEQNLQSKKIPRYDAQRIPPALTESHRVATDTQTTSASQSHIGNLVFKV